jgi:hypothetical protein
MPTLPEQFDYAGIHCYRSPEDANTLLYIPGAPTPQHTSQNAPMISLLRFAPFAFLQISVQWEVLDEELDALRTALGHQYPQLDLATVRLAHAPVAVERVALELSAADGSLAELASTASSGMPPFTAIFSVQLTEPQQAAVASALNGRAGVLQVRYHATLAGAPIERATDVSSWFEERSGLDHFQVVG